MSGYQTHQGYDDDRHDANTDLYHPNGDDHQGYYPAEDGYYDEFGYYNPNSSNPHYQDGGYYDPYEGRQDEYYHNANDEFSGNWEGYDHHTNGNTAGATYLGYEFQGDERQYGYEQSDDREYRGHSPQTSFYDNNSSLNYGGDQDRHFVEGSRSREPYPAWTSDAHVPLSKEEIEDVFIELTAKLGFQRDSMRNMYDYLMTLLDSRASRMTPNQALLSLHADYIGGDNANYRKWYFASRMDIDDPVWSKSDMGETPGIKTGKKKTRGRRGNKVAGEQAQENPESDDSLESLEYRWKSRMNKMSQRDRLRQIALYLLCWGEANQVRFMPECLCFIFKCADDYLGGQREYGSTLEPAEEFTFLDNVITPLYQFIRDQGYEILDGTYVRREKDHNQIIGYDDCNQLFWYRQGIERIILSDSEKTRLIDIPLAERYLKLKDVRWEKCFFKTYKETRSWFHLLVNFNRIWVIHLSMFWFYISYNIPTLITPNYEQELNNSPPNAAIWSLVAFGGAVAALINILATLAEWAYVPRRWAGAESLTKRFLFLLVVFIVNTGPGVYIFMPASSTEAYLERQNQTASLVVGIVHFFIAVATVLFFAVMPLGGLFGSHLKKGRYTASRTFTGSYPTLTGGDRVLSYGIWAAVFFAKFIESWFFLALTLRDPVRNLHIMDVSSCLEDAHLKIQLCKYQPVVAIVLMILTDLVLFFLDTYLWYVLLNTGFSICRSFILGSSIFTPWKNVFSRLPKRIYSKILATTDMEVKYKPKVLISQVWNAIVISMYREHLLSIDHVQKLLYHQVPSEQENKRTLRAPTFFVSQEDQSTEYFPEHSEAERRISFFSQSLSTPIPEPVPIDNMPTFTVLIPHYSEKILLSLREIIREDEPYSRVTLLEYLKQLHPHEWECFVKDTKILAEENSQVDGDIAKKKVDDLPFYCIGFKSSAPEYILRTRIWASLRFQTLYRTLSGFMNYSRAIKLLYRVENPEIVQLLGSNGSDRLERELEAMARRKFKLLVSMQRYTKFTKEEMENTEFLLRAYPDLQIAYLDEEPPVEGQPPSIYSVLIDGHSELLENGMRRPKFRVRLSGNPILGDGKSDNQNHALIFQRGEYIQLVDANQDNYLEECLKIRSVLAEFEEMSLEGDKFSPYSPDSQIVAAPNATSSSPVAILGAREYIFSENIGILGDLAAGKEQTFGTLFARTLAQIGGKLHYGHPDFLNGVFMTTRGGVSKAQKGLHLNEDIYAGMNAMLRGGRIKHCEYYQCGKGRDLGFGSILNFTTKIGTGMGEQMLSREYYYLGTQLPLDRFLSFYYAHAGFHLNNMFIMLSLQLLMITLLSIGALRDQTIPCNYNPNVPIADPLLPTGCQNTDPILEWIHGRVLSIFIVFFINFLPLIAQEALERGLIRAGTRFAKQFLSLSPFFEIFITQIYANSVQQDLSFGGARYIGTGRGFATARIPFGVLYSRFAGPSLYFGSRLLMMLLFATLTVWQAALAYFWISLSALIISPFLYNPHQFAWNDFFVDYREFIRWLSRGNSRSHASSWIGFCRLSRTRITGYKRKVIGDPSGKLSADVPRASITNIFFGEIVLPLFLVITTLIPYLFINAQTGVNGRFKHNDKPAQPTASLIRVAIVAFAPIAVNAGTLAMLFVMACLMGPVLNMCCRKFGSVLAAIAHAIAVIMLLLSFEVMFFLEGFDFTKTVLGMITAVAIQRFIFKLIMSLALTREFKTDQANMAFWTGKWYSMGWHSVSQPAREFLCKITEMSMFAGDFILGHIILFILLPVILIPRIDTVHSILLFWLRPSRQIRPPIYTLKQTRLRKKRVLRYSILYFVMLVAFVALIVAPVILGPRIPPSVTDRLENYHLIQPTGQMNNDTDGSTQTGTGIRNSGSLAGSPTAAIKIRTF